MGFMTTGAKTPATTKPDYTGVQIQTSVNTMPVTILYGTAKIAPNIIDYEDFTKHESSQGGKGLGGGSAKDYTYSATILLALCEGPIQDIGKVWAGQDIKALSDVGLSLFRGETPMAAWGYMVSKHPDRVLNYNGTAYLAAANYDLGGSAALPNHNFEVKGALRGTGYTASAPSPDDADPAQVILDFLTNAQYGAGFPVASIDMDALISTAAASGAGDAALQTYCRAAGICFSPALSSQETATSILQRWLQLCNSAAVWSGITLKFIPYGDEAIANNGVTYQPNDTPVYDLTDDDFVADGESDPVSIQRSDIADAHNVVRLEISDRANNYNAMPIESRDESMVNLHGLRIDSSISADEICDPGVAATVGQLILQRGLYIRNQASFKLSWEYCLLEPMDLITLTDTALGLDKSAWRITAIEEDDQGILTVTAEEFPSGLATATAYPKQGRNPYLLNYNVAAVPVNPPVIFEPPADLSGGTAEIWVAASGSDPFWGGAHVWLSSDGETYVEIGQITQPARQGALSAALPASGGNPDTTGVLALDMSQSGGVLGSATEADAQAWRTLCWVDGEYLAYATAKLTGANAYDLTYLERGLYGSIAAAHLAGAGFVRLDDAIFKFGLPARDVGASLHLKLQSYNIFGGGVQDLADCFAYGVSPAGTGYYIAPPTDVLITSNAHTQSDGSHILSLVVSWAVSAGPLLGQYEVQYQIQGEGQWHSVMVGASVTDYVLIGAQSDVTYNARLRAVSTVGNVSAWANADPALSGSLSATVPSEPTGFAATGGTRLIHLAWSANPEPDIQFYRVLAAAGHDPTETDAAVIAEVTGTSFDYVNLGYGASYSFWLEAVNVAGASPAAGPAFGTTDTHIDTTAIAAGTIAESQLADDLSSKIGLIPTIQEDVETAQATANSEITRAQNAETALVTSINEMLSSLGDGALGAIYAQIVEIASTTASLMSSNARRLAQLAAGFGTSQAQISVLQDVTAGLTDASASQITQLMTAVLGSSATISEAISSKSGLYAEFIVQGNINGLLSGFGYRAGPSVSQMAFEVDSLLILPPAPSGVDYAAMSASELRAAASTAFVFDTATGTMVLNRELVGTISANDIGAGDITAARINIQPAASGDGLWVYDVAGNALLTPTGLADGIATHVVHASGASGSAADWTTAASVDYVQKGSSAAIQAFLPVPYALYTYNTLTSGSFVVPVCFDARLTVDGTTILELDTIQSGTCLPLVFVETSLGAHTVAVQLRFNGGPTSGEVSRSTDSVSYGSTVILIQDHLA